MATQIEEMEAELQRIRAKRDKGLNRKTIRLVLNVTFIVLALIGLAMYFFVYEEGHRMPALTVIISAMILKIIEFVIRFTS